jgi:hypothetical protein
MLRTSACPPRTIAKMQHRLYLFDTENERDVFVAIYPVDRYYINSNPTDWNWHAHGRLEIESVEKNQENYVEVYVNEDQQYRWDASTASASAADQIIIIDQGFRWSRGR